MPSQAHGFDRQELPLLKGFQGITGNDEPQRVGAGYLRNERVVAICG
jgi:hypothetical protein